jgi:hypothetical protein
VLQTDVSPEDKTDYCDALSENKTKRSISVRGIHLARKATSGRLLGDSARCCRRLAPSPEIVKRIPSKGAFMATELDTATATAAPAVAAIPVIPESAPVLVAARKFDHERRMAKLAETPEWQAIGRRVQVILDVSLAKHDLAEVLREALNDFTDADIQKVTNGLLEDARIRRVVELYAIGTAEPIPEPVRIDAGTFGEPAAAISNPDAGASPLATASEIAS